MHIEDGILSPQACAVWYAATAVFVVPGIYQIKRKVQENLSYKPFLAMIGVAVFVISAMHLPVPVTGSCSHPCATALAAILVGPWASAVISTIVLFFQAIFLGHGGITTIGANTFSMGIAGALSGYVLWKSLRALNCPLWLAAGLAGVVGDLMTYLVSAFELAWSLHGNMPLLTQWMIFFMGYAPTQLPLALAEGVFTAVVLQAMASRRPDLLPGILVSKGA
ncbi:MULTISPECIES: energy-coupling factor ABC transporter permease [unclassified Paludibacterium]|uniref:energy-coupling factor ABC transporter permease n=1 Tax=unclassified Paludibacterium TaxID=2618429 RepID=UPI001C0420E1|nr:energy-coupling factor ABC transporter permease [Paludibacterium sp. B53371]BEV71940.1 energy-coupling factor ABC transporter permease [Paludibacterium sp. THUN1379]